jgi:hypothetical protein
MPSIRKVELWACGHEAAGQCGECYRELAAKANELATENERLKEEMRVPRSGTLRRRVRTSATKER